MEDLRAHAIVRFEHLLAIEPFQSTEETRFYLNGVYITPHESGDGALMVATDGHTLLAIYDAEAHASHLPAIWAAAPRATIKATIRKWEASGGSWNKKAKLPYWVQLKFDRIGDAEMSVYCAATAQDVLDIGAEDSANRLVTMTKDKTLKVDGTFPEWRRVVPAFPKDGKPIAPEAISAAYLKRAAETATLLGAKAIKVYATPPSKNGGAGPCRVVFDGHPEALCVIMPMRADTPSEQAAQDPPWLHWSEEAEADPKAEAA